MRTLQILFVLTLMCFTHGCGDNTPRGGDGRDDSGIGDAVAATLLTETHDGWRYYDCMSCHSPLPVEGHVETLESQCAACHGSNGACDASEETQHQGVTTCFGTECHGTAYHGFTEVTDCRACHIEAVGVEPCAAPGE